MFKYHIYAVDKEEALNSTLEKHPNHIIGNAYLDEVWQNPNRWVIEVFPKTEKDVDDADAKIEAAEMFMNELR
jgi:hypothetical protein